MIKVKKLVDNAKLPERAHHTDSGADVFSLEEITIQPLTRELIATGLAFNIPDGYDLTVKDKSGRAYKDGLTVLAGVIDSSYTGELKVLLYNTSSEPVTINPGEKIAQIIARPVEYFTFEQVDDLSDDVRGAAGFGSTGLT